MAEMPTSFYWTLTINGKPAPVGTHVKGVLADGTDVTYGGPYSTDREGYYGSSTIQYTKFFVQASFGTTIYFMVETSPGSGIFAMADQTGTADPGADIELNLTATTPEGEAAIQVYEYPQSARPGESISVKIGVSNIRETDVLFVRVNGSEIFRDVVLNGEEIIVTYTTTMPASDLTLTIEAGHEE